MGNNKDKPTKDSFFKFYIVWPLLNVGEDIRHCTVGAWRWFTGAWYCEHCERYHGRRVHKYDLGDWPVCSIGLEAHKQRKEDTVT